MSKPTKEVTVSEAEKKAAEAKSKQDCVDGILAEARKLESGETHSVQQLMAYVRQLKKSDKK